MAGKWDTRYNLRPLYSRSKVVNRWNTRYNLRPFHKKEEPKPKPLNHNMYTLISFGDRCTCHGSVKKMANELIAEKDITATTHSMSTAESVELPQSSLKWPPHLPAAKVSVVICLYGECQCEH
nr:MAG: hypothetical protein [Marsupenaeus japonicus endogenous nimavirus]